MPTVYLRLILNIVNQIAVIHATCKALKMRSTALFIVLSALGSGLGMFLQVIDTGTMIRSSVLGPLVTIVLPIACSQGPMRVRVTRTALILTAMFVTAFTSATLLLSMGLNETDTEVPIAHASEYVLFSCLTALVGAGAVEGTAYALGSPERNQDAALETPALILLFWTYVLSMLITNQLKTADQANLMTAVLGLLYSILSLALSFATLSATRSAAQAQRNTTNRLMSDRQAERIRTEMESSIHASINVRRLRHDLANQIDVVSELAQSGRIEEADQYLTDLQTRAQALTQDAHG